MELHFVSACAHVRDKYSFSQNRPTTVELFIWEASLFSSRGTMRFRNSKMLTICFDESLCYHLYDFLSWMSSHVHNLLSSGLAFFSVFLEVHAQNSTLRIHWVNDGVCVILIATVLRPLGCCGTSMYFQFQFDLFSSLWLQIQCEFLISTVPLISDCCTVILMKYCGACVNLLISGRIQCVIVWVVYNAS